MNKAPDGSPQVPPSSSPVIGLAAGAMGMRQPVVTNQGPVSGHQAADSKVLDKRRIQELVKEVDPLEQLDDDVEEVDIYSLCFDIQKLKYTD